MIRVGIIGDYDASYINHANTNNALYHAAKFLSREINIVWLSTEKVTTEALRQFDIIWCAPGSPYKNMTGALHAIQYARESNVPFIGTCGGFQHTVIEYARNVLGITDAEHAEINPNGKTLFITPLVCSVRGQTLEVTIVENSLAYRCYHSQRVVKEEYHCNYGLNQEYYSAITENGLIASGIDNTNEVRILEFPKNYFFMATLFLPQSQSTETNPHPIIVQLLNAAHSLKRIN